MINETNTAECSLLRTLNALAEGLKVNKYAQNIKKKY
jgi:hypothetical protein